MKLSEINRWIIKKGAEIGNGKNGSKDCNRFESVDQSVGGQKNAP